MSLLLGNTVVTAGVNAKIIGDNTDHFDKFVMDCLFRHMDGDWGEICADDAEANFQAVIDGDRVMSVYRYTDDTVIWIITEWDRSVTTVLFPDEY